jgi:hypothetical protein
MGMMFSSQSDFSNIWTWNYFRAFYYQRAVDIGKSFVGTPLPAIPAEKNVI